jgi:quercetin dioxygenase-like cupin family protein
MKWSSFPPRIQGLPTYEGRFEAYRLPHEGCEVLFGVYPAGSFIPPHEHPTDNWGVITKGEMRITIDGVERRYGPGDWYHVSAGAAHAARCDVDTEEVEFWFSSAS